MRESAQPAPTPAEITPPAANAVAPERAGGIAEKREAGVEAESQASRPEPAQPAARARVKAQVQPAAPTQRSAEEEALDASQPVQWIERIRELRRKGQSAEAEASLRAFRERYPDYVLPADLVAPR
jgi:hypothetical protein